MDRKSWEACVAFHGHECPGLAIGFVAVAAAKDVLGDIFDATKDEEVVCISENDACGVDAVQFLSGCTLGKGNLIIEKRGKMAFTFFLRNSARSVRLVLKDGAFDGLEGREERMEALLTSPWRDFFDDTPPRRELPKRSEIYNSHACASCGESTAEPWLRIREDQLLCLDCL